MSDEKRPLGKILLQRKLVSQAELEEALRAQKRSITPVPLASKLVDDGTVGEIDALRALSEQYGVPGIDLLQIAIVLDHLDVVPRELAEVHLVLPVLMKGDRIFLAMADPHEKRVVDELEFVTGKKAYPYVAVHSTLARTIAAAYDAKARGEKHFLGPRVPVDTLRQLGLAPSESPAEPPPASAMPPPVDVAAAAPTGANPPPLPRAPAAPPPLPRAPAVPPPLPVAGGPPPLPQKRPPAPPVRQPPEPAIVMDEAIETSSKTTEVSTSEFGAIDQEISAVAHLPDDLRLRASQAADALATGGGKVVLVVDDEEEIRALVVRLLTQKGHRVIEADRGLLALRLVKEHLPDLIILDAMLPELHGFDIARRIKGSAKYGRIPIVMVSAVYRGERVAQDLKQNYGVEEFLEKPFRIASLLDAVQRLLVRSEGEVPESKRDPEYLSAEAEKALSSGVAAYRAGQIDEALEHLKRGVGIDPLSYRLHFHLALLYGKKGLIFEGIQELERAIDLNPGHFAALKNLAVLYEKAGFKNKAVAMWERCASLAPDDATRAMVKGHLDALT
jgi:DNA-binding response OmpR family regulator